MKRRGWWVIGEFDARLGLVGVGCVWGNAASLTCVCVSVVEKDIEVHFAGDCSVTSAPHGLHPMDSLEVARVEFIH
jgi:hypothetical protein